MRGVRIHYKSLERYESEDQPFDRRFQPPLERYDSENQLLDGTENLPSILRYENPLDLRLRIYGRHGDNQVSAQEISDGLIMSEKLFKVIIIGDPTVGKTSFVQRYVQDSFKRDYKGTVGVDFALKIIKWSETQTIKLQLWDIAGQERFTWMTRVYFKDAHGCIIMFDLTNKNSFQNTLKWKKDVDSKCMLPDGSPIPCMLLANKCDLPERQVDQMEVETFYKENNFIGWTETSAKEGLMVNDSMRFLVEVMLRQSGVNGATNGLADSITLKPGVKSSSTCIC